MQGHELQYSVESRVGLAPTEFRATAVNGSIIDLDQYRGCQWYVAVGTVQDTDSSFILTVQHGDESNLSDAATVGSAYIFGGGLDSAFGSETASNTVRKIGYIKQKRYARVRITPKRNGWPVTMHGVAVLWRPSTAPVVGGEDAGGTATGTGTGSDTGTVTD